MTLKKIIKIGEQVLKSKAMINKFFKAGGNARTKNGNSVKNYLLDKERVENETARVTKGDVDLTTQIINSIDFASNYTSGVLSFTKNDWQKLTDKDKLDIINSFEQALLPNFDKSRYSCYWVEHSDKNHHELNYVFAKVDLETGKFLNVYFDKADQKRLDAWRDIINYEYKLDDPNDPRRRRDFAMTFNAKSFHAKALREEINNFVKEAVEELGIVKDRKTLIEFMTELGFVVERQNKNSISIKNPLDFEKRNIRLKGEYYDINFDRNSSRDEQIERRSRDYEATARQRYETARELYEQLTSRREREIEKRYSTTAKHPSGDTANARNTEATDDRTNTNAIANSNGGIGRERETANTNAVTARAQTRQQQKLHHVKSKSAFKLDTNFNFATSHDKNERDFDSDLFSFDKFDSDFDSHVDNKKRLNRYREPLYYDSTPNDTREFTRAIASEAREIASNIRKSITTRIVESVARVRAATQQNVATSRAKLNDIATSITTAISDNTNTRRRNFAMFDDFAQSTIANNNTNRAGATNLLELARKYDKQTAIRAELASEITTAISDNTTAISDNTRTAETNTATAEAIAERQRQEQEQAEQQRLELERQQRQLELERQRQQSRPKFRP